MSSLEAFYQELDARMSTPNDDDWHDYSARKGVFIHTSTSVSSGRAYSNDDDSIPRLATTTNPSVPMPTEPVLSERKDPSSMQNQRRQKTKTTEVAASIQDMTSLIEEFTDVPDSPAAARDSKVSSRPFLEETSTITTPGKTPRKNTRARSKPSVKHSKTLVTSMAKQSTVKRKKTAKDKPKLVTPIEFARRLQEQALVTNPLTTPPQTSDDLGSHKARRQPAEIKLPLKAVQSSQYLKDYIIFYTGGDLTYASARTRGCMSYIHRHGGTVLATFDAETATHIVTETNEKNTLRALGLKSLSEIPLWIPTVKWSWVISGKPISGEKDKRQMDYEFMHAAFPSRMDADRSFTGQGRGKQEVDIVHASQALVTGPQQPSIIRASRAESSSSRESSREIDEDEPRVLPGVLLPEMHRGDNEVGPSRRRSRSSSSEESLPPKTGPRKKLKGFICDNPTGTVAARAVSCINQDIVDKLSELAELHRAKPTQDDKWRVIGYTKAVASLRRYNERLTSLEQAMSLNGVGEKTALKIMEIVETGALRRVDAERTEDVAVVQLFQGIYGVGQSTAYAWYHAGCRTLEDIKERKGGVELSSAQVIGLRYYDDINTRMPREEASEIFREIKYIGKPIQLDEDYGQLSPIIDRLFSGRQGKGNVWRHRCHNHAFAGRWTNARRYALLERDSELLLIPSTPTPVSTLGILPKLLSALRYAGIITEDLSLPASDGGNNLEGTYRGLCISPATSGQDKKRQIQRRLDILAVPWESRGAALIYYTGDDIFNRSLRQKANVMGYSLNQRGLFAGVVRSPEDRTIKTNIVFPPVPAQITSIPPLMVTLRGSDIKPFGYARCHMIETEFQAVRQTNLT
ncbi:hypothetical protein B0F90DRAFT_1669646 [Multifurca ochricompacta]|uniref:DNA polymerase lambda n=1 Tax=Multifurca ochricompacta TaxID=376703 RepID=A0AAD4M258_9AGAM|nr:hypothetical protein B0F90DRAFT_1669646 [Multifurca ochricompacta]